MVVFEGTFTCGECHDTENMYLVDELSGTIKCEADDGGCVQHGESSKRIMHVWGTGCTCADRLVLRGLTFYKGKAVYGGGLVIDYEAVLTLELCIFSRCYGTTAGGGGAIEAMSGTLDLFAVSFALNYGNNCGDDIESFQATISVYGNCPNGYGGDTSRGERQNFTHFSPPYPLILTQQNPFLNEQDRD